MYIVSLLKLSILRFVYIKHRKHIKLKLETAFLQNKVFTYFCYVNLLIYNKRDYTCNNLIS